jgi:AGCS family alanine or glycine:cation symporter
MFGNVVFSILLPVFAFTTILAWSYYGEMCAQYLFGEKNTKISGMVFKIVYVGTLAIGALTASDLIWALDDMFNALMALPNLIALLCMSGLIYKITKNYYDRKKGLNVEPMLSAYPEVNEEIKAALEKEHVSAGE